MTDELPTVQRAPGIVIPEYAPGLKVEAERDLATMVHGYELSLHLARRVTVADDVAMRGEDYARQATRSIIDQAVRQMQDEAVTALGLNRWREEIRRELHAEELRERRRILLAVRDGVRTSDNTDKAALLVQDEIDALGVA